MSVGQGDSAPWTVVEGDCIEVLRSIEESSVDAVVTDPPYGIGFMGHEWDQPEVEQRAGPGKWDQPPAAGRTAPRSAGSMEAGKYDLSPAAMRAFQGWTQAWATEALRVLKPGGHLLSFAATRTNHRHVCGIEDAGFEIRDSLVWLFGSGFPKSRDLGDGRGTALKPGHEPITLARKPFKGSATANVAAHGTGGLNIDTCRVENTPEDRAASEAAMAGDRMWRRGGQTGAATIDVGEGAATMHAGGRWPANVILDEEAAAQLDEQSGQLVSGANPTRRNSDKFGSVYGDFAGGEETPARGLDIGGASRFFYCAKASRVERNAGLDGFEPQALNWSAGEQSPGTFQSDGTNRLAENHHPTVKPIDLMRWLVRLVTPAGGLVLDPFVGSGTTGCAAVLEDRQFIGIDREAQYVEIAKARIAHWRPQGFQLGLLGAA